MEPDSLMDGGVTRDEWDDRGLPPGSPCPGCGAPTRLDDGAPCSPECEQRLTVAMCEASGHMVQGDTCYCGQVAWQPVPSGD